VKAHGLARADACNELPAELDPEGDEILPRRAFEAWARVLQVLDHHADLVANGKEFVPAGCVRQVAVHEKPGDAAFGVRFDAGCVR
jgi:hypothetical protein